MHLDETGDRSEGAEFKGTHELPHLNGFGTSHRPQNSVRYGSTLEIVVDGALVLRKVDYALIGRRLDLRISGRDLLG